MDRRASVARSSRLRAAAAQLAVWLLLLGTAAGCGGAPTRTVTVERPAASETSTTAPGRSELSRQDSARVAKARLELRAYCAAVRRGDRPSDEGEVAALATLIAIFMREPYARFDVRDSPLALAEVLKLEADSLADGCDPKAARLLRQVVDVGVYTARPR